MYPVCDVEIDSGQIVSADGDKAAVTKRSNGAGRQSLIPRKDIRGCPSPTVNFRYQPGFIYN